MQSRNRVIICAAGGGKTTGIVKEAILDSTSRIGMVTYTRNNQKEIENKFYSSASSIPAHVEVLTWFSLLLRELARPYRSLIHNQRIDGIHWVEGRSVKFAKENDIRAHYFLDDTLIYSDKISKFICECNRVSKGAVMRRLARRFDHIFVDEIQDMAGYDLDVLELILQAGAKLTLVGDHRQATFRTNHSNRHAGFSGTSIIKKFEEWDRKGLAVLSYEKHSHRCNQEIVDLGDSFFPHEPHTKSLNTTATKHDGVFTIPAASVPDYVAKYRPQVLRFDRRTNCEGLAALNFGEAKGLTFDRVLIFPNQLAKKWLSTGNYEYVSKSASKMYVGTTRARFSVAFVFEGASKVPGLKEYL